MGTYILRRALQMVPLLLVISLMIFMLTALQPGDPVDQLTFGNTNITVSYTHLTLPTSDLV